jgi:hypothetical protein
MNSNEICNIIYILCPILDNRFAYVDSEHVGIQTFTQQTTQNIFPNNIKTATEIAEVIEGHYTAVLNNDMNGGKTNNTFVESTDVNVKEDCMSLPNQSGLHYHWVLPIILYILV